MGTFEGKNKLPLSIVVHQVDKNSANIWIGSLKTYNKKPTHVRINYKLSSRNIYKIIEMKCDWSVPLEKLQKGFWQLHKLDNLSPNKSYDGFFEVAFDGRWVKAGKFLFETFPSGLPDAKASRPFNVLLGSCYYEQYDRGQVATSYKKLYEYKSRKFKPHIKFLTGDQVYLDLTSSFDLGTPDTNARVLDGYATNWRELGSMLKRGGTWMLPDDHEFWNDYPYVDGFVPTELIFRLDKFREKWKKACIDGVNNIQQTKPVTTFSIGKDLSFCLLDTRTNRDPNEKFFSPPENFEKAINWARSLTCPGVIVLSQPLIQKRGNKLDRNLLNFERQYIELIEALASSNHDIVALSGDVHYSRIAKVPFGKGDGTLYEVISSPMSNLSGISSISTSTPEMGRYVFPRYTINGFRKNKVDFIKSVSIIRRRWFSLLRRYKKSRTTENFMTLGFSRKEDGKVNLKVQAWSVRSNQDNNKLPKRDFRNIFSADLK